MQVSPSVDQIFALITGGSEGIGRAIAYELAARGYGLLLVALPGPELDESAAAIRGKYHCPVHTLAIDMGFDGADLTIFRWVQEGGYKVSILVNNAGYGQLGPFGNYSRDFYSHMIHLNVVNVVGLTRLMLEVLQKQPRGHILNVGSIASFFPMPYKVVYASTKYFIYSFSRALREELLPTGIRVSLLCPGPVNTNDDVRQRIDNAGYLGRITSLSPEYVGKLTVRRMLKGGWLILPGFPAKVYFYIEKVVPTSVKERFISRRFRCGGPSDQI